MVELSVLAELKQQHTKEGLVGNINLSNLHDGFYPRCVEYISGIDCEAGKILFASVKRMRLSKISRLVIARVSVDDVDNLSPEEVLLYTALSEKVESFWSEF